MKRVIGFSLIGALLAVAVLLASGPASASVPTVYFATLNGPSESPPNSSTATGAARVDLDTSAHTLRVQLSYSGLTQPSSAGHIHACTATPGSGTMSVAVPFTGLPNATSGTYDRTFDTSAAATYTTTFLNAHGGTAAGAETALAACIAGDMAYVNVHNSVFPNGEIRGFLHPAPVPATKDACKDGGYQSFIDPRTADTFRNQGLCVSFVAGAADDDD